MMERLGEEEMYINLFHHSLTGMAIVNTDGSWSHVNPALCRMLGFTKEELLSMTFQDITHPEDVTIGEDCAQKLTDGEIDQCQLEKRYIHKLGHIIWVQVCTTLVRNDQGKASYFISQTQDITQHIEEKKKLKRIESLYNLIAKHSQDIIFYSTPDGICLYVTPSVKQMLGYEPYEMINEHGHYLWHPDDLKQYLEMRKLNVGLCSCRLRHKNGHYIWFEIQLTTVPNMGVIVGVARNISKRVKAEEMSKECEQRYKSMIKHAPVGIFAIDKNGRYLEANPAFEQITGYTLDELQARDVFHLMSPDRITIAKNNLKDCLSKPLHLEEAKLRKKDGTVIDINAFSSPIIINGHPKGAYFMVRDVSEQKRAQEALQKAEKLTVVGELAAGIAHEIRNPLTSIRGFIQLLLPVRTEHNGMFYDLMLSEIDRINGIVSELLVLSKPANEAVRLGCLSEKLNHVITLLEGQAHLYDIVIHKNFDKQLPWIYSQDSLKQVFINVLKNAIESMPDGGEIWVQAKQRGNNLHICFIDQGCGIPEDQLHKIGSPFYTTKDTGTGLGMMICQRIVHNHKGVMCFKSKVGKGTTVEVILPIEISNR